MLDTTIVIDDDQSIREHIDQHINGVRTLSGLDLYLELERSSPLLEFHTMIRQGPQNRAASGLQQSYGDHNRLLLLAIDKLIEGDLDWYRSRLDGAGDVTDAALLECFDGIASRRLPSDVVIALFLAAAMHDCGMLGGRGARVDVEDGIVLSRPVIESLCPDGLRPLAYYVLHNHDYVKDVYLGEVPAAFVADELDLVDPQLRPTALCGLGIIQVAGAASLGEGRLGSFRIDIFRECFDGRAATDVSSVTRLSRLLRPDEAVAIPARDDAQAALDSLAEEQRARLDDLLAHAALHGFQKAAAGADVATRITMLQKIAERWFPLRAEHVVIERGQPDDFDDVNRVESDTALSGARMMSLAV